MVGCGLACPGGAGVPGCRGASSGGRGGGGTVGDRIRGLGVSGRGGGVLGDPYHMGGGGKIHKMALLTSNPKNETAYNKISKIHRKQDKNHQATKKPEQPPTKYLIKA